MIRISSWHFPNNSPLLLILLLINTTNQYQYPIGRNHVGSMFPRSRHRSSQVHSQSLEAPRKTTLSSLESPEMSAAKAVLLALLVGAAGAILGVLTGFFVGRSQRLGGMSSFWEGESKTDHLITWSSCLFPEEQMDWKQTLLSTVDRDAIREYSRELTRQPHLAASERDKQLARYIRDVWLQSGLDSVELVPYNVLISLPDSENPNKIFLINKTGDILFMSLHREKTIRPEDESPDFIHAYNAYSPKGDVIGELVYVNYAREDDFDKLEQIGISVKGRICIARYGKIYRGNQLVNAQQRGSIGLILFADPAEVARDGIQEHNVYPYSWWLPGSGIQRGSVRHAQGDALTPGWPSIDGAYRMPLEDTEMPKLPTQPIGYDDARRLLEILGGPSAPSGWAGGLSGMNYTLGPGFKPPYSANRVRLVVNNRLVNVTSYNVIGRINGALEPDRYILLGNHRDAWGFGAVDPSSGTAALMETVRVIGRAKKSCRPARTLIFCSWGAEEVGLIGSTEWVEENLPILKGRAVAYVNSDVCAAGPRFAPKASPLLHHAVEKAAERVPDPTREGMTMREAWAVDQRQKEPRVQLLGSGTDHSAFAFYAGIPAVDFWFSYDTRRHPISMHPSYHSGFETFHMMDKFIDPGFKIHRGCTLFSVSLLSLLSDSHLLPFNITHHAEMQQRALDMFYEPKFFAKLWIYNATIQLDLLKEEIKKFQQAATDWHDGVSKMKTSSPVVVRRLNDILMSIERAFILPQGLPGRPDTLHALFAPSSHNNYIGAGLPGLADLLHEQIDKLPRNERGRRKKEILRHLSDLLIMTRQVTKMLGPEYVI